MAFKNEAWPVKGFQNELTLIVGRITGGGASTNCTITAGLRGVSAVATRSSTGKYQIVFSDVPEGTFLGVQGIGGSTSDSAATMTFATHIPGTYDAANKLVNIFVTDAATPSGVDLATTQEMCLQILFARSAKV